MNPFIVAELSANHLGGLERALKLIDAAKEAGADAVKFQTYRAAEMVGPHGYTIQSGPWAGRDLLDLYKQAETPRRWHQALFAYAKSIGIEAFSTPFSADDVDFLEELDCPRYKIASFELVDLPLIRYVASKGKPMIMSTGMATGHEITEAKRAAASAGCQDITFLKCTSGYPAPLAEMNLQAMVWMVEVEAKVGISDHTLGMIVPIVGTVLGASMIEKHLTLKRADGGPDSAFSLEPQEFADMVRACREARESIGEVRYGPSPSEMDQLSLRRSLYWAQDARAGAIVQKSMMRTARPALGLHPGKMDQIEGMKLMRDVTAGEPVTVDCLSMCVMD